MTQECTSKDGIEGCTCDPDPCEECSGDGTVECWGCGGDGIICFEQDEEEGCEECDGGGEVSCDNCNGTGDQPRDDEDGDAGGFRS